MRTGFRHLLATLLIVAGLVGGSAARAEGEMTTTEMQSLACLGAGTVSTTTATVLGILSPLEALSLPVIAAAFAAGCGVGAVAAPGIHWLARNFGGWIGPDLIVETDG